MTQSIFALIVGLLGLHMLVAAARHRALPELWIGLFFVWSAIGSELALRGIAGDMDPLRAAEFMHAGAPILTLSTLCAYGFTYSVFRRGEPWARGVVVLGVSLAAWGTWVQLHAANGAPDVSGLRAEFLVGRFACFAWGTYEATRAYTMARRRLAFGLADPVVVNRFLLFGIWFGVMGVMPMTLALARLYGGVDAQTVVNLIGPKIVALIMAVALILTFFPPRRYLAWVVASSKEARA
jgi:hypothetical protein